jgi:hypothetical protein
VRDTESRRNDHDDSDVLETGLSGSSVGQSAQADTGTGRLNCAAWTCNPILASELKTGSTGNNSGARFDGFVTDAADASAEGQEPLALSA